MTTAAHVVCFRRKHFVWCDIWRLLFALACVWRVASADTAFQSRSHFRCEEPHPPFNADSCDYFTQYAAFVDLVGGGEVTQVVRVVGTRAAPLVNLVQFENGTVQCPPDVACTPIDAADLTVRIVRSPLPEGIPRIMPEGNVSVGFYWKLTRNNHYSPDYRIPYAYTVSNCSATRPYSSCADAGDSVEFRTFDPFSTDDSLDVEEPECGAQCDPGFDLRGTCGANVPPPERYLSDNDGRCSELCCGDTSSVKVRQTGPYCYMFSASGTPGVAVDFAVLVESVQIGPDPVVVPVYGISDPQTLFVNETGVRVRILSLLTELERFDNTNAFSVTEGSIVICPNHTTPESGAPGTPIFPNELDGPVANVSHIDWFYMPSPYGPYYGDTTSAEAAQIIKPSLPSQQTHQKIFGESGGVVEQAAAAFIVDRFGVDSAARCANLSDVLPFVPGYDTDHPLSEGSPYNLPSPCSMWSEARTGNPVFLPPASDLERFNWFIREGVDESDDDLYLIYVPTRGQIDEANAEGALQDALLASVEISDVLASYDDTVTVPVTAFDDDLSPPSCFGPKTESVAGFTANVTVLITVKNTLSAPLDDGDSPAPVTVELSCTPQLPDLSAGGMLSGGSQTVTLDYDQQKRLSYTVPFVFENAYQTAFKNGQIIGSCEAKISGAASGNGQVGPITCIAGGHAPHHGGDSDEPSETLTITLIVIGASLGVAVIIALIVGLVRLRRRQSLDKAKSVSAKHKALLRERLVGKFEEEGEREARTGQGPLTEAATRSLK